MSLVPNIKFFIQSKKLLVPGDKILVGISGGGDSVALALILNELKHELGVQVHLAHFNHKIRSASDQEQAFVEKLSQVLNIPLSVSVSQVDLKSMQGSLEDNARQERFKFLFETARDLSCDKIALAHHKNDLAETVLMKILRGSGLQGLQAIRPRRMIGGACVIRPMLCAGRSEIEEYLHSRNQPYCQDETNMQTEFLRNKIRHELLPVLEREYNSNIVSLLANLSETTSEDYDVLEALAQKEFESVFECIAQSFQVRLDIFSAYPLGLRRLMLRLAARKLTNDIVPLSYIHLSEVEELMAHRPDRSVVDWPDGLRVLKQKPFLVVQRGKDVL